MDTNAQNADETYRRQLTALKTIVPQLTLAQDVRLCGLWIERLNRSGEQELHKRNQLMSMLIRQLTDTGSLRTNHLFGEPSNVHCEFADMLADPEQFEQHSTMDAKPESHAYEEHVQTNPADQCRTGPHADFSSIPEWNYRCRHENRCSQWTRSELDFIEETLRAQRMRQDLQRTIDNIEAKMKHSTHNTSTLAEIGELLLTDSWSNHLPVDMQTQLERIARNCAALRTPATKTTDANKETIADDEPVKYKQFALKSARKIKRLQDELNALRRDQAIRASSESIRQAAWRTEWMFGADARQQAELTDMLSKLDGRCRELLQRRSDSQSSD